MLGNNLLIQRQLAHILLFLATLFIGLHAFLPHVHGGEPTLEPSLIQTEETSIGFLELLGDIFELDLGEGHLEHLTQDVEKSWNSGFSLPLLLPPVLSTGFYSTQNSQRVAAITYPEEDLQIDAHHSSPAALRGPPVVA